MLKNEKWREWQVHPVTVALGEALRQRINDAKDQLVGSGDRDYDLILKGMIRAFTQVLHIEPDFLDEEFVDEVSSRDVSPSSNS